MQQVKTVSTNASPQIMRRTRHRNRRQHHLRDLKSLRKSDDPLDHATSGAESVNNGTVASCHISMIVACAGRCFLEYQTTFTAAFGSFMTMNSDFASERRRCALLLLDCSSHLSPGKAIEGATIRCSVASKSSVGVKKVIALIRYSTPLPTSSLETSRRCCSFTAFHDPRPFKTR